MATNPTNKRWPIQDAEAHFSDFLEVSLREGPQILTRQGTETAVLLPVGEWRRLQESEWQDPGPKTALPTLKELLLADSPRGEIPLPDRRRWRRRQPSALE